MLSLRLSFIDALEFINLYAKYVVPKTAISKDVFVCAKVIISISIQVFFFASNLFVYLFSAIRSFQHGVSMSVESVVLRAYRCILVVSVYQVCCCLLHLSLFCFALLLFIIIVDHLLLFCYFLFIVAFHMRVIVR